MEFIKFKDEYKQGAYELFCDFQKEDDFYMAHTFEEFDNRVFKNHDYRPDGTFVCLDNNKVVGFAGALVRACDEGNEKSSGYIHTIIVKKEYRRQGIGSKLLALCEDYIKSMGKTSSRCVFLSSINWPWYIPHTDHHMHPGMPAVPINCEYYIFLYHHQYVVNSIHEGFHLNLCDYSLPEKVKNKMEENAKEGLTIEIYDPAKHTGVEEFCQLISEGPNGNTGFANAIRSNLKREKPYPFIIAADHGKMVGWTGPMYNEPTGRGHLDGICVSPLIRGKGLGTGVFAMLCSESKKNGAKYMTFFTGLDNPARYIYLGAGFQIAQSFADMKKNF